MKATRNRDLPNMASRWTREAGGAGIYSPNLRASSSDRDQVVSILQDAYVNGELATEDLGNLLTTAFAARTCRELDELIRGLPPISPRSPGTVDSSGAADVRSPSAVNSSSAARRLVTIAASLLPEKDRPRFCEEYRSELWDLTSTGATRRQQLGYASRQLLRALSLRAAVLSPRRRRIML
jgi:hypothetical protein